jgi:signal recognition particle receptor subunit beta
MILITKNNCEMCEWIKSKIPKNTKLTIINTDKMDKVMASIVYESLKSESSPILIFDNKQDIKDIL